MATTVSVIEVLGPGCRRCRDTAKVVQHVIDDAQLGCAVQKNESVERMVQLGVMSTPAVVFDGKLVLSGHVPKTEEIRRLLGLA